MTPLELGALTDRLLELERGLVQIGEQSQRSVQLPQLLGGHQPLQALVADHAADQHAVLLLHRGPQ